MPPKIKVFRGSLKTFGILLLRMTMAVACRDYPNEQPTPEGDGLEGIRTRDSSTNYYLVQREKSPSPKMNEKNARTFVF